jgi:hypothetical protein
LQLFALFLFHNGNHCLRPKTSARKEL